MAPDVLELSEQELELLTGLRRASPEDGNPAAGSTATRKRATFNNAMEYVCEQRILPVNPLTLVKWTRPRVAQTLDLRVVANPDQARRLLDAVRCQGKRGERMVAFFAVMYYARTPYDLRHAAVSTWLGAGVPPAQVAEWAGHGVAVLLRVYAKCVAGQEEDAKRRISAATRPRTP